MNMNPSGWRPDLGAGSSEGAAPVTFTGNRALLLEEPLIFELGDTETTGVDFDLGSSPANAGGQSESATRPRPTPGNRLSGFERTRPPSTAPEIILSRMWLGTDAACDCRNKNFFGGYRYSYASGHYERSFNFRKYYAEHRACTRDEISDNCISYKSKIPVR